MNLKKKLCMIMLTTLVASCVFVANESQNQYRNDDCHVSSKKLTLTTKEFGVGVSCHGSSEMLAACLVTYGVIVPVGSLIVSGSVVVVGNVLNWIEVQKSC
ncbi:MAG: hypothetical protein ACI9CO_000435 [Candidatus Azotimanducaceae bacterium]|jgi:hypothetical protein